MGNGGLSGNGYFRRYVFLAFISAAAAAAISHGHIKRNRRRC